jgi:hypothetical protein
VKRRPLPEEDGAGFHVRFPHFPRATKSTTRLSPDARGILRQAPKLVALGIVSAALAAQPRTSVVVPASANPYLAGMPDRTKARQGDRAPDQSPVLVGVSLEGATAVTFAASGGVGHGPMWPLEPPDGSHEMAHHIGFEHGIAEVSAPFESLMGVFLGADRPDRKGAPRGLNFTAKRREATILSPQLKQVFWIGSGSTKGGALKRFVVPAGATRLSLGTMDEYGWFNNEGSFTVTVSVESPDVTSTMFSVASSVSFADWPCLPDHSRCTPGQPLVEARGPGLYHVLLPAHLEWGVSIPNPSRIKAVIRATAGTVCLDRAPESCSGPQGRGDPAGPGFVAPAEPPGALVTHTLNGRTWFSVNDRGGPGFQKHDGFFEFDVSLEH